LLSRNDLRRERKELIREKRKENPSSPPRKKGLGPHRQGKKPFFQTQGGKRSGVWGKGRSHGRCMKGAWRPLQKKKGQTKPFGDSGKKKK